MRVAAQGNGRLAASLSERELSRSLRLAAKRWSTLDQAFEEVFKLTDFGVHGEGGVSDVVDGHGEQPIVAEALQLGDDAAVFDLALADADLELARPASGIAQMDVAHIRIKIVVGT